MNSFAGSLISDVKLFCKVVESVLKPCAVQSRAVIGFTEKPATSKLLV